MLPENRRETNVSVAIATILQVVGFCLTQTWGIAAILGLILVLTSIPIFIWGCSNYAEGKGHSKWVGLIGIAGLIGLILLVILPEQDHEGSVQRLQMRKLVGLISMVFGLGLAVLGRWFGDLAYTSAFTGGDVPIEESSADVCMVVGVCVTLGGLVLLTSNRRRHVVDKQSEVLEKGEEKDTSLPSER